MMRGNIYFETFEYYLFGGSISVWNTWPNNYNDIYWTMLWKFFPTTKWGIKCNRKNGPRYWAMDKAIDKNGMQPKKSVYDFFFTKRATIPKSTLKNAFVNKKLKPFYPIIIERDTIWIYEKNKPIFILQDKKKRLWILQSTINPIFNELLDYNYYKEEVDLPRDWMYIVHIPKKTLQIPSLNKRAFILRDTLENTFMFVDPTSSIYDTVKTLSSRTIGSLH